MERSVFEKLPGALLPWYRENKRDLPWRHTREPYAIWLSEIMLQQTRVEAVKGYYASFLQALPTVQDLAQCDDELLHKLWEGLGYYSRVRNLKKAAQQIVEKHGGIFPTSYPEVAALPGIGAYTAGAICSIAFNRPTPAVDGNVLRLVSRLTADFSPIDAPKQKELVSRELAACYPEEAGDFTQALIELGATVCGPNRAPDCENCPCRGFCRGYAQSVAEQLPVKSPKKGRRIEEKTVFILSCGELFALRKRPDTGLLAGLWQFPDVPGKLELQDALAAMGAMGLRVREVTRQVERRHIFTHVQWEMRGFFLEVEEPAGPFTWMSGEEIEQDAALPTAYRQFREETERV